MKMKAKSIAGNTPEEIKSALDKSMADGFNPCLGIVFISIKQDWNAVNKILNDAGVVVMGASSSGEFINEHQSEGGIVIMLLEMDVNAFEILFTEIGEEGISNASKKLAQEIRNTYEHPEIILLGTGFNSKGEMLEGDKLIHSIKEVLGEEVNLFGAMAGDDMIFEGSRVFTLDQHTDHGMVTLVLDGSKISIQGMAISGWKPYGIYRTITKSERNLIYTIDDKPALEMYLQYLGHEITSEEDKWNFFNTIGIHYPIQIEREDREPMMCNPIGHDQEKDALVCEANVPEGAKFRFSFPPEFDISETIVEKAQEIKKNTHEKAEALFIFSCVGRLSALGPMAQDENEGLAEVWDVPMAGFYSYGEFGNGENGKLEYHSTTNSWVVLKEK